MAVASSPHVGAIKPNIIVNCHKIIHYLDSLGLD